MPLMFHLRYRGSRYALRQPETTIGRSASCPIMLMNEQASRQHAKVIVSGGSLRVVDLDSRNGTRVNGELIKGTRELASGDTITIGTDHLEVVITTSDEASVQTVADEDTADTNEPSPDETSLQSTLQFLEAALEHKGDRRAQARKAAMIRAAIDQYVRGPRPLDAADAARIRRIAKVIRSWSPDGAENDWYFQVLAQLEVPSKR